MDELVHGNAALWKCMVCKCKRERGLFYLDLFWFPGTGPPVLLQQLCLPLLCSEPIPHWGHPLSPPGDVEAEEQNPKVRPPPSVVVQKDYSDSSKVSV